MLKSFYMRKFYYLLFVIGPLLFILAVVLRTISIPGYIYFRDVTESVDISNLFKRYIYTYSNDIGESLAEKARIPLFFTILSIYKIFENLGFGDDLYIKIKIIFLFASSFIAFLLTTKKFINKHVFQTEILTKYSFVSIVPAVIGAFFYTTNFWFTNRIAHFGLFFSTVTIPIVFYFLFDYFFSEKKDLKKLVILSIILGLLTATPHTVLFEIVLFASILFSYLITRDHTKDKIFTLLWHFIIFLIITLLVNMHWILPYLASNSKPDAEVSETIVELIGRNATLENSLGLMGYWLTNPTDYPIKGFMISVPYIPLLFLGFTFVALRTKKQRQVLLTILILFLTGAFLSTCESYTNIVYFKMMFDSPFRNFAWLFREYDKFGLILSFVYSLSISIILRYTIRKARLFIIALFPIALTIIVNLTFLNSTLEAYYQPVIIPDSYSKIISLLSSDPEESNILWYPGNPKPFWANSEEVRYTFSNLVSPKPSVTTRSEYINYANYLFNLENIYSVDIGEALDLIGVKYLIIRKDESIFKPGRIDDLLNTQTSINLIYSDELLTIYENKAYTGLSKIYNSKIETNAGLNFLKSNAAEILKKQKPYVDFTDRPSGFNTENKYYQYNPEAPLDFVLNKYSDRFIYPSIYSHKKEDGNPGFWKTGSLENISHAEVDFFLNNLGLNIKQFDFGRGVIIARDGWQMSGKLFNQGNPVETMFSAHPNVVFNGKDLRYNSRLEDFIYYWNIIKSDRFDVLGKTALGVRFNSDISDDLIPHYKFTFYGEGDAITGIIPMYQNERGLMENVVKIPEGSETAVFSIWTVSTDIDQSYSYELKNFILKDISKEVKPISILFSENTGCDGNLCNVYVRLLKSTIGGKLQIKIGSDSFDIETKTPETTRNDRYEWVYLGKVDNSNKDVSISISNINGFNSINAFVFLNELESLETTNTVSQTDFSSIQEEKNSSLTVKTKQINPTKYELTVFNDVPGKSVLSFSKPYNKNWILKPQKKEAGIVNGYINGWEFDNIKAGTYIVEYKPQEYFQKGAVISGVSAGTVLLILVISYLRSFSASERKSKSQG